MAFRYLAGPEPVIREFYLTDSEAATFGKAYVFSSGRLTAVGTTAAPAAIALETVAAGTDVKCTVLLVAPGMLFEADASGTYAATMVGTTTVTFKTGVASVDLDTLSGGKITVLGPGSSSSKVVCTFSATALFG